MTTGILGNLVGPDSIIIVVAIVVVLLFGGSRLPKLARGLGSASHEFRKGLEDGDKEAAEKGAEKGGPTETP